MIGLIAAHAVTTAVHQMQVRQEWTARFNLATPDEKQLMLAERDRADQERRHRETIEAIKAVGRPQHHHSTSSSGPGFGTGVVLGLILGK